MENGIIYARFSSQSQNKQKHVCNKLRENKDNLEAYVTSCVVNFLRDKKNAQIAVDTVFAYYEKR